mmetsp:Transcript_63989/g.208764  ORF Transcript_63989/g.208764 Transcript_63989/m.208764 type:complete len:659 (+) Transcript_63989:132-2108(+)
MTAAISSMGGGAIGGMHDDSGCAWEMEVVAADMETRLRNAILRMMRPALDQVSELTSQLRDLALHVAQHDYVILEVERSREVIIQQGDFAKILKEQCDQVGEHLRKLERNNAGELYDLRNVTAEIDQRIEKNQGELRQLTRDMNRSWDETSRVQDQNDKETQKLWDGIFACNKKTDDSREECMQCIRELQIQRQDLLEDLFGEGKGLTRTDRDLSELRKFTAPMVEMMRELESMREKSVVLETSQAEVLKYIGKNRSEMVTFYKGIDDKFSNFYQEFKKDSNHLVAHHASLMKDIRRDYTEEMNTNKSLRDEITKFQRSTEHFSAEIAEGLRSESRRMDAIHKEILQDSDEQKKRRKKDRAGVELELNDMRRQVGIGEETAKEVRINVEFLSRIIGLVLEGERLSSAMFVQDFADKSAERWLSLPSEQGRRATAPLSVEALEQQRHREAFRKGGDLVAIDWRKGLVTSDYLPGQVAYQGIAYERRDLMLLHHKLLHKAHSALMKGPSSEKVGSGPSVAGAIGSGLAGASAAAAAATTSVLGPPQPQLSQSAGPTMQPSARGGIAAGQVVQSARAPGKGSPEDLAEDASKYSGMQQGSNRQRPGSQGQPQAMGSRGSMSGPLGDTSPLEGRGSVGMRLPSINGDSSSTYAGRAGSLTSR